MIKPRIFYVGGVMSLLFLLIITLALPGPIRGQHTEQALVVRAGFYQNPPKLYTDAGGAITGFWPDLLSAIAADEGWTIEWVPGTWDESLARLENGQIDVMPDVAWSEPRSQKYAFSTQKVLVSWSRLYARPGSNIETVLDLEGKTVAGLAGSVNYDGAEGIKDITGRFDVRTTFVDLDNYTEVFEALQNNTVDAGVTNKDFGNQYEREYTVERTPFIFQPAHIEFAFPQNGDLTPLLREHIDAHVGALKADPHSLYYQLLEKYLEQQPAATVVEIVPGWVRNVGLAGGAVLLFLLAVGVVSRVQVRRRTADLQQSEQKFRALFEYATDGIFIAGPNGRFVDVNARSCEITGYTRPDILTMTIADLIAPRDLAVNPVRIKEILAGQILTLERWIVRKDGTEAPVEINTRLMPDGTIQGIMRDITDRKRAKEALRQQEHFISAIVNTSPAVIYVYDLETQSNVFINSGIERLLGYSPQEIQAMGAELFARLIHPDDIAAVLEFQQQIAAAADEDTLEIKYRMRHAGGSWLVLHSYERPFLRNVDGSVKQKIGVAIDITERKRAEEALRKSEARLKEAEKLALLGHWELNLQNDVLYWSDEIYRIFELDPSQFDASYKAFLDTVHPDDREFVDRAYTESVNNRTPYSIDHRIVLKDGRVKYVHEQCETYYDEQGHAIRSLGTVQDITERKQVEDSYKEAKSNLEAILDNRKDSIWSLDRNYNYLVFNKPYAEVILKELGVRIEKGMNAMEIHPEEVREFWESKFDTVFTGEFVTFEFSHFLEGSEHHFQVFMNPIISDGEVTGASCLSMDITERKQAEEALREIAENMAAAQRVAHFGSWQIALTDDLEFVEPQLWSDECYRIFGVEPGSVKITSEMFYSHIHPDDREFAWQALRMAIQECTEASYEYRLIRADSSIRYLHDQVNVVLDEHTGRPVKVIGTVQDITERKQAEEALRESETKFRSVIEQATDGISLTDEQGIITEWNRSMAELTGLPAETVLGRYVWDVQAQLNPDMTQGAGEVTTLKQSLQNILKTGHIPWAGKLMEREYDHPDGSQRYIQGSVSPIQTAKGFMLVSLSRDVTERKQAEDALRQSEERYRTLFEEAGDGIMVLDEQNNPLDANKRICDMLGYTRDELMSTNVVALIHPDDLQNKDHAAAMEALLQGQSVHSDYRLKRKDGVYVPTELNTKMLGPGRFLNIGRDITERMQAQKALQRYNDRLTILRQIDRDILAAKSPQVVAQTTIDHLTTLIPCEWASVKMYENEDAIILGAYSQGKTKMGQGKRVRIYVDRPILEQLRRGEIVKFADLSAVKEPSPGVQGLQAKGLRTYLTAPLAAQNELIGTFSLGSVQANAFTSGEEEIVMEVANQMSIAIRQARLNEQIQQRLQELTTLHQASMTFSQLLDPVALGQSVIEVVEEQLGYQRGALFSLSLQGELHVLAHSSLGLDPEAYQVELDRVHRLVRPDRGIGAWVTRHGQAVRLGDVRQDPRYIEADPAIQSELCVPLLVSGRSIGALNVESDQSHAFTEHDERLLTILASQVAVALENARLFEQIQRHAEELEQRVAERTAELDARNRELETFTYSVSHDLKAPLRGIDGYSHLLLEEHAANLNDEGQAFLRTIRQAAAQMGELIDDLLAYSRLERRPHQSEAVDVPVLLESLLAERTADIQAGNVTVNVDVSACAPITADPDGLMLALRNLLDNALKFTQKAAQPIIEVGGRKSQNGCIIWIRDSGIGFDMKFHDRIFDIFQRLHRLEEYPGTGIGLAIVSKAIERMGGRVWAQSEPGRGATFYLEIPAERK